ncbi:hypothetical protein ACFE04_028106 [Oxalis oulophora]
MAAITLTNQIGVLAGATMKADVSNESRLKGKSKVRFLSPSLSINSRLKTPERSPDGTPPMSPCPSPAVVCHSTAVEAAASAATSSGEYELEHGLTMVEGSEKGVPVFVMMPLDSVKSENKVNKRKAMDASMQALKCAGVEGIMMDVWWGLVERENPGEYNWGGYAELLEMAKKHGLKVQAVMSFHKCGGNVGDSVTIPLPKWVVEEVDKDQDLAYTDQWGRRNYEYLSLGCDTLSVLKGRTPVQCYADFMRAFRNTFSHLLGDTIVEIQVGMGPAGELRYPSYPEQDGIWRFPGIGAFQCYDKYMLSNLKAAAEAAEMRDHEQPQDALCAPEKLVRQVALATKQAGVALAGENALPRYDDTAHDQIMQSASLNMEGNADDKREMCAFTYLRMNPDLFQADNWRRFVSLVKKMKEGKDVDRCLEQLERESQQFVHVSQPLVQEAAAAALVH